MHFHMHTNHMSFAGLGGGALKLPPAGMLRLMPRPPSPAVIGPMIGASARTSASGLLDLTLARARLSDAQSVEAGRPD